MSNKKIDTRELYRQGKQFLDIKAMFPKSSGVGRGGNLTPYQARKIKSTLAELKKAAGGNKYLNDTFVKIRRTKGAREYIESIGLPKYSRGVLLPGGEKINSGVTARGGALHYTRGDRPQMQTPLDAVTEKRLRADIRRYAPYINNPDNIPYIITHGGKINGLSVDAELEGDDAVELLEQVAGELYNKYAILADNKDYRPEKGRVRGKDHGKRKAAHPDEWGLSLLVEIK